MSARCYFAYLLASRCDLCARRNQFDGEAGAYDLRWADIVEASSSITVSSSSYSGGSIDTLADVDALAAKLQKSRGDIVSKSRRVSEGVLFYDYEFGNPNSMHELLSLCVNKSRLWQISAKSPEKSWSKREDLYRNVVSVFRIHQRHPLHRRSAVSFPSSDETSSSLTALRLIKSSQRADQDSSLYVAI